MTQPDDITEAAKQKLRASTNVAALPAFQWEELEILAAGLEALGELGILRDAETPYEPLVIHSLITAIRETQISIERALLVTVDLATHRERRRGVRRNADRRPDLQSAILSAPDLDEIDRESMMALYKALARRPRKRENAGPEESIPQAAAADGG